MATRQRTAGKGKKGISVDFSDTEKAGVVEEGDYLVEVTEVEQKTSESSGADYLSFELKITEGEFAGKKLFHNCSLQPQALFNLRAVLEALGMEVPQGTMELEVADLIGMQCGVSVAHEQYEGKTKARPVEFFSAEELGGEEEAPAKPAAKTSKAAAPAAAAKGPKKKGPAKAAEPEIEIGSAVSFTDDDGNELTGEVTAMADGQVTVKVGVGKKAEEWELDEGDVALAE